MYNYNWCVLHRDNREYIIGTHLIVAITIVVPVSPVTAISKYRRFKKYKSTRMWNILTHKVNQFKYLDRYHQTVQGLFYLYAVT